MRKLFYFMTIVVVIVSSFSMAVCADNTNITDVSVSESANVASNQDEENHKNLESIFIEIFISTNTLIHLLMSVVLAGYILVKKREIKRIWASVIPFVLILITFLIRLLLYFDVSDFVITIVISVIQVIYLLIILHFWNKSQTIIQSSDIPKSTPEKKACETIQKLISKSHYAIECIQLYSLKSTVEQDFTSFQIGFIGGSSRQGVDINALFSTSIKISNSDISDINAIQGACDVFAEDAQEWAVSELILGKIQNLKERLNKIESPDDISENECYLARILLICLSLYATIEEHDTYIGLGRESLNLKKPDLEPVLFTYERTGILGAILLNQMPYVFSYRRCGGKAGRFYYTYSCGSEKKYIVMISMRNKNKSCYIDTFMERNLKSIRNRLVNILGTDDTTDNNDTTDKEGGSVEKESNKLKKSAKTTNTN